ncbi:hypothetical protein P154DRAFT_74607 [Amniculicola lignicola CBS 123094]|uniref:Uncharacterized protein n=1 Tax=Amniculicola lignicola CBS 123094 TaxID=1392246 RepID=A0A6A5VVL4_9PLEO|nr:hypothetical protein P154DRAFT_74607 [Amniculicola lignicola CBS 123094]
MSTSGSTSEFQASEASNDGGSEDLPARSRSKPSSQLPSSPRKRRRATRSRSRSNSSVPDTKRHLQGLYNDGYRTLFNEDVLEAAARFDADPSFDPPKAQIGGSQWSREEKSTFFAALGRLGRSDLPGLAKAVVTKSIPEVQELLILLQDGAVRHKRAHVTLRDIPAATEISPACDARLEWAADALAWTQERFEAKQEQDRYGTYWLITPEVAEEIEEVAEHAKPWSRAPSLSSSAPPFMGEEGHEEHNTDHVDVVPQLLQDIPEGKLLRPASLLTLSTKFFMNGSPDPPSLYPNWTTMVTPLATQPSMYRTALIDFHCLVVSFTKRLVQASIVQATSRIRSQGWRRKKAVVHQHVKSRDVLTATDVLNIPIDGKQRWQTVARRCRLRVYDGRGKSRRELSWQEVEASLSAYDKVAEATNTDDEVLEAFTADEREHFGARAARSGTPGPVGQGIQTMPEHDISDVQYEDDSDDIDYGEDDDDDDSMSHSPRRVSPSTTMDSAPGSPPRETVSLEAFDQNASRIDERYLWEILKTPPPADSIKLEDDNPESSSGTPEGASPDHDDWRDWTDYRADWEEHRDPVSPSMFTANQRGKSPPAASLSIPRDREDIEYFADSLPNGELTEEIYGERHKRRKKSKQIEIPVRGSHAYAALQERLYMPEDRYVETFESDEDDSKIPAESIEREAS